MAELLVHRRQRAELIRVAIDLVRNSLNDDSGNLSCRVSDGFLVTPSAISVDKLQPADIVYVGFDGRFVGKRKPSSEWPFHLAIYLDRPEVNAIAHCHSLFAEVLSMIHQPIWVKYHYTVMSMGGDVRCVVPFELPGGEALARRLVLGLRNRHACLIASHGQVTLGATLQIAAKRAKFVERAALRQALAFMVGKPVSISPKLVRALRPLFQHYGQGNEK